MPYTEKDIIRLVEEQRGFFRSGATLPVSWRKEQLLKLKSALRENERLLTGALKADLGRSDAEAYFCDIGTTLMEIEEMRKGLHRWAKPEVHASGLHCFPSAVTRVYKLPYGVTLIISPYNFPVLLTLGVLAAAIAGGNTAVIKASSKSPACTVALQNMLKETFPESYIALVDGGHETADLCLDQRFDKIFYTGSPKVAKHVMAKAAENLTPVAFELGGENGNWCIVRKDADLRDAARKIAFLKLCNSGQICININQIAVAAEVADDFLKELQSAFTRQIGENALANPEYPHLITKTAYDKCASEAERYRERILYGGRGEPDTLRFEPTIIYPVSETEEIVNHELFSPLLPVVPFRDEEADQLLEKIADREQALALYLFTKNLRWAKQVMATQQYGGGCINEVCMHMLVKGVPFNGTGHSGMGAYHGEWGFREFTHPSTVLIGSTHGNLPLREHPYSGRKNAWKQFLVRLIEK